MAGFDCQFTEEPPRCLQSHCPICLLILREPFQVTCCGKSFCRACIQRIVADSQRCPTCKQLYFELFRNKGLQQPLYGFKVFCSSKASGCDWQGELGQLDQHLNLNPDKEKMLIGCKYTNVKCLFCKEMYQRSTMKYHQGSQCVKRPFTCSMCEEYTSTYDDVITNHTPVCKCRPVECPNSCGANNLQHQHLEEHVSTQCPLSYVDCEFSDAGCDAKVYRKNLSSHMEENMVTHMSLLARCGENMKKVSEEIALSPVALSQEPDFDASRDAVEQAGGLESMAATVQLPHVVPVQLVCSGISQITPFKPWRSGAIYSHTSGYRLQLYMSKVGDYFTGSYSIGYQFLVSQFPVTMPCTLEVTVLIRDPANGRPLKIGHRSTVTKCDDSVEMTALSKCSLQTYVKNNQVEFRVVEVKSSY